MSTYSIQSMWTIKVSFVNSSKRIHCAGFNYKHMSLRGLLLETNGVEVCTCIDQVKTSWEANGCEAVSQKKRRLTCARVMRSGVRGSLGDRRFKGCRRQSPWHFDRCEALFLPKGQKRRKGLSTSGSPQSFLRDALRPAAHGQRKGSSRFLTTGIWSLLNN